MAKDGFAINVFSLDPDEPSKTFEFRTHSNVVSILCFFAVQYNMLKSIQQAEVEYKILEQVQDLVESHYIDGRPRHHLPSARNVVMESGASIFFIVEFPDFVEMEIQTIQDVFRHRNIVVRNVPQRDFQWCLETLSLVGGLYQSRDIQGV